MKCYLKEALLVRPRIPLLGGVPVDILAAIAFGIRGIAHPGFWLLDAGVFGENERLRRRIAA